MHLRLSQKAKGSIIRGERRRNEEREKNFKKRRRRIIKIKYSRLSSFFFEKKKRSSTIFYSLEGTVVEVVVYSCLLNDNSDMNDQRLSKNK